MLDKQEASGPQAGGWVNHFPFKHTYRLQPPWLSGMAQGQGASLLVRIHRETGDERYAEGAISALAPMWKPPEAGRRRRPARGRVATGGVSDRPGLPRAQRRHLRRLGVHDVSLALGDERVAALAAEGIATLAASLDRYDTGAWSRYDLFPHPTIHLASPMYHQLHINQLRAMATISPDPRFPATASRFEHYAASRGNVARAYAHKVAFRLVVPRNRWLAHRLPWNRDPAR